DRQPVLRSAPPLHARAAALDAARREARQAARPDPGAAAQPRAPAAGLCLPSALRLPLRTLLRRAPAIAAGRGRARKGLLVPGRAHLRGGRVMQPLATDRRADDLV